jgi:glucose-1-phosphate thymidylyltransferase
MTVDTAVVLAAGEGTRLRPLTRNRPKPMLPAANRPVLEYVLDALVEAGVAEIHLVVGYCRDRVQEHFGHSYRDVSLTYVHQEKQLGSGHALLRAADTVEDPMLVLNGDRIIDATMVERVGSVFQRHGDPCLAVLEHPRAEQYGAVEIAGEYIERIVEKRGSGDYRLINAGIYAFTTDIFDDIEATPRHEGELALTDTIARRIEADDPMRGVRTDGLWVDATYPWDLLTVARELLSRGRVQVGECDPGVCIADSAIVHEDASLQPPVVGGADCEVAAGAVVGPDTVLGRNVTVGANATIVGSVLGTDTRVGPGSTLVEVVAGQDCDLGAGTLVPGGPADVRVGDRVFTDRRLGAVFADGVTAAGDVTCLPGALVGADARLGTGIRVDGTIAEGAEVVR